MSGARISYGKLAVPVQCVGVAPLRGLPEIPESPRARARHRPARVRGEHGGARAGVPRRLHRGRQPRRRRDGHDEERDPAPCAGARRRGAEGFLDALGRRFLGTYAEMEGLRLTAREQPFAPVPVGAGAERSDRLFSLGGGDTRSPSWSWRAPPTARVELAAQRSGQVGLRLLKTTGSAFTRFARDDATTLPERADRPLFVAARRALALRRPGRRARRRSGPLRRRRAGARRRLRRVPRVRLRVDPAPRARDGAAAARALPGARGGLLHGPRTTRSTPCRARIPAADRSAPTRRRSRRGG